jgi:probable phosphoglycerate mutase
LTPLALIRHGPTAWAEEGRIQGWTDVPLSRQGRAAVKRWRLPAALDGARWVSSPLRRAQETARLLGKEPVPEERLKEMSWGDWEGERIEDLRARLGETMALNEARGLDFRPPGGESPRDLQVRLAPWLAEVGRAGVATAAVCHNGVIRAVLSLAIGWDMSSTPDERLTDEAAHLFLVDREGRPRVERLNVRLEAP